MSQLIFLDKVFENRPAFAIRLSEIALRLGIDPGWLMIVFYIETAAGKTGRIDHRIRNASTGATGLIQFMPRTARSLGTDTAALQLMTNVQQLDYVEKYLAPFRGKMKCLADVYLAVFFPIAIGKPDNWVLQAAGLSAETVARFNPLYDLNRDGQLTVGEIKAKLMQFVPKGYTA
jgi:hypothetical protein